jgi:Tol biopolymer transport system component
LRTTAPRGKDDRRIARADGSQARDLTNAPATNDLQPDISPEGNAIAYSTGTDGQRDSRIAVLDLRSGLTTRLTPVIPGQESFDPSWSPSGRWIVFDTLPASGNGYLWIVRSDGTDLHRITDNAADACQPDWGPNDLIAYTGGCDQLQTHLFVRDPLGLFVHQLTRDADGGSPSSRLSHLDGLSLTYSRFDASFDNADVWRLDSADACADELVDGRHSTTGLPGEEAAERRVVKCLRAAFGPGWARRILLASRHGRANPRLRCLAAQQGRWSPPQTLRAVPDSSNGLCGPGRRSRRAFRATGRRQVWIAGRRWLLVVGPGDDHASVVDSRARCGQPVQLRPRRQSAREIDPEHR